MSAEFGDDAELTTEHDAHGVATRHDDEPHVHVDAGDVRLRHGANTYAAKKSVAQGMMDIALITANANQLRYLIEYASESRTYHLNVVLITISLFIQVAVGVSLIFKGRYDLSGEEKRARANNLNNFVVIGVFIVTIINVFVAAFSLGPSNSPVQPVVPLATEKPAALDGPY